MDRKILYIIISLTGILLLLGSLSIYLFARAQNTLNQVMILEDKIGKNEKQQKADGQRLLELEKRVENLKNELDYYADIPKNPLYEDYKKRISTIIGTNFTKIISRKKFHSGQLFMTKIRFIDPNLVNVKYEDGHSVFDAYIRIIRPDGNFRFEERFVHF